MQDFRSIIYIPQWIAEVLAVQKEPLATILDYTRFKELISQDDLISFISINKGFSELLGFEIDMNIGSGIISYWMKNCQDQDLSHLTQTILPQVNEQSHQIAFNRLLLEKPMEGVNIDEYQTYDLGVDVSGVLLHYGFFNRAQKDHVQYCLIEAILQILYAYYPHHQVAVTAVGRRYLELLATQVSFSMQ